jgi:type VI secretion system protein ImpL
MTLIYIVLGVTLLLIIALVVVLLIRRKKAKAAAAEAEEPAAGGDEIGHLIKEAEAKLSAAKVQRGARVGNLPLLLLMGEPGTTKTSVVLNSGLEPELLAGQVYQNNEITPTRTANIWFKRHTLFLEAGGRLLGDPANWKQLVKRLQPRASLVSRGEQAARAAVVCFDCEAFTRTGAMEAAAASARTLRARLGEISQSLGINVPVYVLFTRIDRLPFFLDYVRNLDHEEATQVFGVTLPMAGGRGEGVYAQDQTNRLNEQFERLFRSLADARTEFLSRETEAGKLPGSYEFPREFRKIRPVLVQFLVDLCRPSELTTGPFLRGFYFTGARPVVVNESAPVAMVAAEQAGYEPPPAGATGIFAAGTAARRQQQAPVQPVMSTRKVPQWMFLTHLFTDILLADKSAMGASGASTKTSSARRILFLSLASVCLLATTLFTVSFFRNRALIAQVRGAAQGITSTPLAGGELAGREELGKLETLRGSLERSTASAGSDAKQHSAIHAGPALQAAGRVRADL